MGSRDQYTSVIGSDSYIAVIKLTNHNIKQSCILREYYYRYVWALKCSWGRCIAVTILFSSKLSNLHIKRCCSFTGEHLQRYRLKNENGNRGKRGEGKN